MFKRKGLIYERIGRLQRVSSRVCVNLEYYGNVGEIESFHEKDMVLFQTSFKGKS